MRTLVFLFGFLAVQVPAAEAEQALPLRPNDVVVLAGGTEMVRQQKAGYLETLLTAAFRESQPRFRDLSWEADTVRFQGTVDERWRRESHFDDLEALGDWEAQLERVNATVIIAQYGAMESLDGPEGLDAFISDYGKLLDRFASVAPRLIVVSPSLFEKTGHRGPDLSLRNHDLTRYIEAIRKLAEKRGLTFVDLARNPVEERTADGWQTSSPKLLHTAAEIGNQLGLHVPDWSALEPLRQAVVEKHRLWYDYWRPANWKCLFGDDGKRVFSKAAEGFPSFQEEWAVFPSLIEKAERQVHAVATGNRNAREWEPLPPKGRTGSPDADLEKELAAFTAHEGYSVNLFADESHGVANPLSMRWDADGRLYVACTNVYPQIDPGALPDDHIVILEDTDGDGRADKSTRFAEGLNIPTAMELGDGGVYVGQNTEILFLRDLDGDLRADEKKVILSGFGNGDSHQTINTFVWSPGGELFFCQGDGIESRVETPWGISSLYGPGAFRLRPRRLELDGMLNNFMGPGNPWGVAFDDWGQAFVIDGAGGISHLTPAFLPVKQKLRLPTIGRPGGYCGIDVLASDGFPEDLRHDFVIGDYKENQITRFSTPSDGAGFNVRFEAPLLKSSHRNFRPVDVRVGPDDGVYVADFYNPLICHQDDFYRHPIRDKTHGRIWRVAPEGKRLQPDQLTKLSVEALLKKLESPQRWTRYQAKRLLSLSDPVKIAIATMDWSQSIEDDFTLLEGLRLLESIEEPNTKLLQRLLNSREPRVRAYATRVTGRWADRLSSPLALLRESVRDPDIRVRLEAALALGEVENAQAIITLARLTDQPMDRWLTYAFKQAVRALQPFWEGPLARGEIKFDRPLDLAAIFDSTGSRDLASTTRELITSTTLDADSRLTLLLALIAQGESRDIALAFRPEFRQDALAEIVAMTRNGIIDRNHPEESEAHLKEFLALDELDIATSAIALAGLWELDGLAELIIARIADADPGSPIRKAGFETLGRLQAENGWAFLQDLARSDSASLTERGLAVAALCRVDLALSAELAAALISREASLEPADLLGAFLSIEEGTATLTQALTAIEIHPDVAPRAVQALVSKGSNDTQLRAVFEEVIGLAANAIPEYSEATVQSLARDVEQQGNPSRGEEIYRRATMSCDACHQIRGAGGVIGPDLTAVGNAVPLDRLIEEVLWPQRQIKEGYNLIQLTLEDGEITAGYLEKRQKNRDDDDMTFLRDPATGTVRRVENDAVANRQELGSAMPPGLVASLTPAELRDLIAFLRDLGSGPDDHDIIDAQSDNDQSKPHR